MEPLRLAVLPNCSAYLRRAANWTVSVWSHCHPSAFGHDGAGGQVAFADPEAGIAAAFVRNQMTSNTAFSGRLLDVLYACAGRA